MLRQSRKAIKNVFVGMKLSVLSLILSLVCFVEVASSPVQVPQAQQQQQSEEPEQQVIGRAQGASSFQQLPLGEVLFQDDFDGDELNAANWAAANVSSMVNSEIEYYAPDDVMVVNGSLMIRAQKRTMGDRYYTSGRIDTVKFDFMYGEVEMRAKMHRGPGLWPAFWYVL